MSEKVIFKNVQSESSFRIYAKFHNNSFDMIVLQELKAWKASITEEYIAKILKNSNLSDFNQSDYYEKLQEYFEINPDNVSFVLQGNSFILYCHLNNSIKIKYFYCDMISLEYVNCVEQMLEDFFVEKNQLQLSLDSVCKERDELDTSNTKLQTKFQEFTKQTEEKEEQILEKCVLLLNEKKMRIQHLTELVEAFKSGSVPEVKNITVQKQKGKQIKSKHKVQDEPAICQQEDVEEDNSTDQDDIFEQETQESSLVESVQFLEPSTGAAQSFKDMFNLGESPAPTFNLPKRRKLEEKSIEGEVKASTSGSKVEMDFNKDVNNKSTDDGATAKDKAIVDFSTQDLLEML